MRDVTTVTLVTFQPKTFIGPKFRAALKTDLNLNHFPALNTRLAVTLLTDDGINIADRASEQAILVPCPSSATSTHLDVNWILAAHPMLRADVSWTRLLGAGSRYNKLQFRACNPPLDVLRASAPERALKYGVPPNRRCVRSSRCQARAHELTILRYKQLQNRACVKLKTAASYRPGGLVVG